MECLISGGVLEGRKIDLRYLRCEINEFKLYTIGLNKNSLANSSSSLQFALTNT